MRLGSVAMNNKKNYAHELCNRAEECLGIAAIIEDSHLKAEYLKLADAYLKLAAHEERMQGRVRR